MSFFLLIARPFAETGVMDDWSYKGISQSYLYTGQFIYNGWANAMLGWQIPYGALFMHFLGPTFLAVRLSTLPLAFGCVVLFQLCAARFGIQGWNASLGALALGLSPVFLPLAASYMSDMGALFVLLVCLWLCQRAVLCNSARNTCIWLITASATNLIGGTIRQIAWLGLLVMVPSTGWILRHRRAVPFVSAVTWITSTACVFYFLWWFRQQPYTVPEQIFKVAGGGFHLFDRHALHVFIGQVVSAALCFLLLITPILAAWIPRVSSLKDRPRTRFWAVLCVVFLMFFIAIRLLSDAAYAPWLQHILYSQGVWPLIETNGNYTPVLGRWFRTLLSAGVLTASVAFFTQLRWRSSRTAENIEEAQARMPDRVISQDSMLWLLIPFMIVYGLLLLPRAYTGSVFDRYFLAILPAALMLLIRIYQENVAERLPVVSLVIICLFAGYSIMALHDTFAALRAEIAFTAQLKAHGIPRRDIDEGWVSNAQAQLEIEGHIDNPLMDNPRNVPRPYTDPRIPAKCAGWFPITALRPKYFMVWSPTEDCFRNSTILPVTFVTWLPPHQHALYTQELK